MSRNGGIDEALGSLFIGQIANDDGRAGVGRNSIEWILAATGDNDLVPAFGEQASQSGTDAGAG